jgi:hypothetical protein
MTDVEPERMRPAVSWLLILNLALLAWLVIIAIATLLLR